jgi:hypothetical protein
MRMTVPARRSRDMLAVSNSRKNVAKASWQFKFLSSITWKMAVSNRLIVLIVQGITLLLIFLRSVRRISRFLINCDGFSFCGTGILSDIQRRIFACWMPIFFNECGRCWKKYSNLTWSWDVFKRGFYHHDERNRIANSRTRIGKWIVFYMYIVIVSCMQCIGACRALSQSVVSLWFLLKLIWLTLHAHAGPGYKRWHWNSRTIHYTVLGGIFMCFFPAQNRSRRCPTVGYG